MRTRKEIETNAEYARKDRTFQGATGTAPFQQLLEVLLDLREQNEKIIALLDNHGR